MADDTDKAMAVPTPYSASSGSSAQPAPNVAEDSHDTSKAEQVTDTSSKPRISVDFAAHQLPFRPAPMVRKRRAATESPERDGAGGDEARPETTNTSAPPGTGREDYLARLAGVKAKPTPKGPTPPSTSMLKPLGNGLPTYEETTGASKSLTASKWAQKQSGEASDEVEMGGADQENVGKTSSAEKAARRTTEEVVLPNATEFTGMPALDLLHGSWMKVPAHEHMESIIEKIISALKKRQQPLILQGRSIHYHRIDFDLDAKGPLTFRKRLEQCFFKQALVPQKQRKVQRAVHKDLEEKLRYVVCWNLDAFPELAGRKDDVREIFPALFPGSYTSVLNILKASHPSFPQLDFGKHAATAKVIFDCVLQRVRTKAPDSPLLRVEALLRPALSEIRKDPGETKRAFRARKRLLKERNENAPTPPESLLTLAFTTENFYTGLVRKMGEVTENAKPKTVDIGKVEAVVETLLYRLAMKEPRAFPEVFAAESSSMVDA